MRKAFSFLIGAVLGGLVGAGVALLFAPESGVELRARLNERAKTFSTEIQQAASSKRIELQERLDGLRKS